MPKIFGREIHPIVLVGAAFVAVFLVSNALQPPEPVATRTKPKAAPKKTTTDVEYNISDYTAQFASLNGVAPKDAFRPLITKLSGSGNPSNPSIDNFTYSGMALLNNEPNGLLENGTTGEGDFVKPGEHWHQQWLVVSVTPDQIDLKNDVGDETKDAANSAASNASGANAPFNPAMIGQIGSPDLSIQADGANPMPNQNGRGRRGGRRGGGRGGGGGNYGQQGGMNNGGN